MAGAIQAIGNLQSLPPVNKPGSAAQLSEDFSTFLTNALDELKENQISVHNMNEQFIRGELQDVHNLMIAAQKASIGLELTVQVRNKAVEAYQEIMRIQI